MTVRYDYTDQVALVTGAGAGMGRAAAQAFAEAGASTVLLDRDQALVQPLAAELTAAGHTALAIAADVTDEHQVASAVAEVVAAYGRLDVAFNNAGIMTPAAEVADTDNEVFDRVVAVNLRGMWNSLKHELAQMRTQGSGAIVNNSSIAGLIGDATRAAYSATKHGILGLTKSIALETGAQGIRVNAVCPGTIDTPMVERMIAAGELNHEAAVAASAIPRLGRSEEIAAAVLWLCSPGASYVTGAALPVDGGYTAR
jgi:NAD(P)-dependent dehydrogenase (short-subunit alcohol dehydrogenase family)